MKRIEQAAHIAAMEEQAEAIISNGVKVPPDYSSWRATRTQCFLVLAQHFQNRIAHLKPRDELARRRATKLNESIVAEALSLQKLGELTLDHCMEIIANGRAITEKEGAAA